MKNFTHVVFLLLARAGMREMALLAPALGTVPRELLLDGRRLLMTARSARSFLSAPPRWVCSEWSGSETSALECCL